MINQPPDPAETETEEDGTSFAFIDPRRHADSILALHAQLFDSPDPALKRVSYMDWLLSNPASGSIYIAAFIDGKLASFLGFMARDVVGAGKDFRVALAFSAMTWPEYAGRKLYRRLVKRAWQEAERRGFDFCHGYTTRDYVLQAELRMGWRQIATCPVLFLPIDIEAIARSKIGAAAALLRPLSYIARFRAHHWINRAKAGDVRISEAADFSDEYDAFNDALRSGAYLMARKCQKSLRWLYLSPHNPFSYTIIEARRDGMLVGFGVGRHMDLRGLKGFGIQDLVCLPGHEDVLAGIAAALTGKAMMEGKPYLAAAMVDGNGVAEKALRSLGFIRSGLSFAQIHRGAMDGAPNAPLPWWNSWGNNDTI